MDKLYLIHDQDTQSMQTSGGLLQDSGWSRSLCPRGVPICTPIAIGNQRIAPKPGLGSPGGQMRRRKRLRGFRSSSNRAAA